MAIDQKLDVETIPVDEFVRNNYSSYGSTTNRVRYFPQKDGLKSVTRRILYTMSEIAVNKEQASTSVVGYTIQNSHPFGDKAIYDVVSNLARLNIITGVGDFGSKTHETLKAAAMRYTQVYMSKSQYKYFFYLEKYAEKIEGELREEAQRLIVPVPLMLITGGFSWGIGVAARYPAFTYESILDAFTNNDPSLLKSSFGYEIDYTESNLEGIWNTGKGRLVIKYPEVYEYYGTVVMKGSAEIFAPNLHRLQEWESAGLVEIDYLSTDEFEVHVRRVKGIRRISDQDILNECKRITTLSKNYNIIVSDNDLVLRNYSMKQWISECMIEYVQKHADHVASEVNRLNFAVRVAELTPMVARDILDQLERNEILSKHADKGLTDAHLSQIMNKSISTLYKKSFDSTIHNLKLQLDAIKSENVNDIIVSFKDLFNFNTILDTTINEE